MSAAASLSCDAWRELCSELHGSLNACKFAALMRGNREAFRNPSPPVPTGLSARSRKELGVVSATHPQPPLVLPSLMPRPSIALCTIPWCDTAAPALLLSGRLGERCPDVFLLQECLVKCGLTKLSAISGGGGIRLRCQDQPRAVQYYKVCVRPRLCDNSKLAIASW